ncbi:MAG: alpha amylase C-terminal domain-containing protein [Phycisphaerales bacterium]|nr:alpha amylase C-terminal domain-containing protein [Phycisphaerales bacterium]
MTTSSATRDGTGIIRWDPLLEQYRQPLRDRYNYSRTVLQRFASTGGLTGQISQGHHYFGLNRGTLYDKPGVWYREWAPAALQLRLIGDFNHWNRFGNPLVRDNFGIWSLFLPDDEFGEKLVHGSLLKVHVVGEDSTTMDRIPAYARRVVQEARAGTQFVAQYWLPAQPYRWRHESPVPPAGQGLRVYEAHVGMASEQGRVATYNEFADNILPRIKRLGYNAVQLMAIQEHPYYGSFGYHVSNFYAPSSRFGTPEDLKRLIDAAHGLGLLVLLDLVHSHSVRNTHEGLNLFDGSDYQYFHAGPRGHHIAWDSKLFDYSKYEVLRFLLSNCRYWLEEFRFDGLRFDGVTSMLYLDHGLGRSFTRYDDYFGGNVDRDALAYLQLANELVHQLNPRTITVAEDVSGMVGLARPVAEGGIGFDYRLAMGVPDYWIKLLKERKDEQWNLGEIFSTLLNRRYGEKHIGYAESHDQALVGDKTLAFWLMDKEMYWNMNKVSRSVVIDRGVALHKLIRLITFSLAGDGYLNFMGNEFGHPEWIDFPREGNGYSYHYCRRQWSLADNPFLRYEGLQAFDVAMEKLDEQFHVLTDPLIQQLWVHEENKQLVYRRGPLVFAFNFHPSRSFSDWRIPVPDATDYRLILTSDAAEFSGPNLVKPGMIFPWQNIPQGKTGQSLQVYVPSRTAIVLAPIKRL